MRHIKPFSLNNTQSIDLNRIESMIPERLKLDFEIEMFLNRSPGTLSAHHTSLINGNVNLYESISKSIPEDIKKSMKELTEAFKKVTTSQKRKIFENIASAIDPETVNTKSELEDDLGSENMIDVAGEWIEKPLMTGSESGEESGIWSTVKGLFSTLTEGGSPIGIFQFILDIVGLVGDFFGPVGMIADALNAIIYCIRGKWFLAILSAIAAIIPVGGNIIKGTLMSGVKAGVKGGKGAVEIGTMYFKGANLAATGTAKISDDVVNVAAKAAPDSMKHLDWVARSAGPAVSGLAGFIKGFFDKFLSKMVGWIPGIGKPLSRFFDSIGGYLGKLGKVSDDFITDLPQITAKAQAKQLDDFFKLATKPGAKIITKGDDLILTVGKESKILTGKVLANSEFLVQRYGKTIGKPLAKSIGNNTAAFYASMASAVSRNSKFYGTAMRFGELAGSAFIFTKKIPLFIGRQVLKWITGDDGMKFTEDEAIGWGTKFMNELAHDRRDRNLEENKDAFFDVPIFNADRDAALDEEFYQISSKVFNDYAKTMNLPRVGYIPYYVNREKDRLPEDVANYYNAVTSDIRKEIDSDMLEWQAEVLDESKNLKHIKGFRITE